MQKILPLLSALLLYALLPHASAFAQQPPLADRIDTLARDALQRWKVPGLALVVVHDDRVLFLNGFGVREIGKPGPVTADTVFPVASCTKSFTTLALAMLASEGKLDWDDHVRKHVPFFRLADPLADANVMLRDLACHRAGLASHDLLWYHSEKSVEDRVRMLAKVEPASSFRSQFQYQTVAFGAAGLAVGTASKSTWSDFVAERILKPLEMKSSSPVFLQNEGADLASPHKTKAGRTAVLPRYPLDQPDPAGSLHSTARDLANYLRFQLGDGSWQGKKLLAADHLREPQRPQIVLKLEGPGRAMNPETQFLNYGLGWVVQDYRGKRIVLHGGAIDGFRSQILLLPDAKLGIAVLNNLDNCFMNLPLSLGIIDLVLGLPARDWNAFYLKLIDEDRVQGEHDLKELLDRKSDKGPRTPLASYAGKYDDPAYGPCEIEAKKDHLVWKWGKFAIRVEHHEGELFLSRDDTLDHQLFLFRRDDQGRVAAFRAFDRIFRRSEE
jgi:CubicO group peptidase (beta-lactamase class C family)